MMLRVLLLCLALIAGFAPARAGQTCEQKPISAGGLQQATRRAAGRCCTR